MTDDERAFLDATLAQPDDDTVRLVYADWLAENSEPDRGEFIRVQIELARTPPDDDVTNRRRAVLFGRAAELLKAHRAAWLAPFAPFAKESSFERGFVQFLAVPAKAFVENAEKWTALTPLTRVKITTCSEVDRVTRARTSWAARLLASPHLARLVSLDLEWLRITATDLEPLATQPDLSRLRELVLGGNPIGEEGATLLANMPQLSNLEALDLRGNSITNDGARAIAESPFLTRLKELRLSRNSLSNATWQLLEERFFGVLVG